MIYFKWEDNVQYSVYSLPIITFVHVYFKPIAKSSEKGAALSTLLVSGPWIEYKGREALKYTQHGFYFLKICIILK